MQVREREKIDAKLNHNTIEQKSISISTRNHRRYHLFYSSSRQGPRRCNPTDSSSDYSLEHRRRFHGAKV